MFMISGQCEIRLAKLTTDKTLDQRVMIFLLPLNTNDRLLFIVFVHRGSITYSITPLDVPSVLFKCSLNVSSLAI